MARLAGLYVEGQQPDRALELYGRLAAEEPDQVEWWRLQAELLERQPARHQAYFDVLKQWWTHHRGDLEPGERLVDYYLKHSTPAHALNMVSRVHRHHPDAIDVLRQMAHLQAVTGDSAAALSTRAQIVRHPQRTADDHREHLEAMATAKPSMNLTEAWAELHRRFPRHPDIVYGWAESLVSHGRMDVAAPIVEQGLRRHPGEGRWRALKRDIDAEHAEAARARLKVETTRRRDRTGRLDAEARRRRLRLSEDF
ncbi:MAG: tetratricopeptide repeat protein [Bradymonadia bacterium]